MSYRSVYLYGALGDRFGMKHRYDVRSPAQAVRGLICAYGDPFGEAVKKMEFQVLVGNDLDDLENVPEKMLTFGFGNRDYHFVPVIGGAGGKKGKGFLQIILGIALISAAFLLPATAPLAGAAGSGAVAGVGTAAAGAAAASGVGVGAASVTTGATLFGVNLSATINGLGISVGRLALSGASFLLQGVASLLSPTVNREEFAESPSNSSFLFNTALNTDVQGGPVPILYGRHEVGSVAISAGGFIEQIEVGS